MMFKVGVRIPADLDPRMPVVLDAIEWAWGLITQDDEDAPTEATITSWGDGAHGPGSYHKQSGRAVDVRTKSLRLGAAQRLKTEIERRVGHLGVDVVLEDMHGETEHLHVELDKRADQ
jgi:hypothetical protein